jgi:hypothetical protein
VNAALLVYDTSFGRPVRPVQGAINGVFQASMYQYAQTGDAGQFIETRLAAQAFAR